MIAIEFQTGLLLQEARVLTSPSQKLRFVETKYLCLFEMTCGTWIS